MDSEVAKLTAKIAEVDKEALDLARIDKNCSEAHQERRELLYHSSRLTNALQNEGQIVEGYLYGGGYPDLMPEAHPASSMLLHLLKYWFSTTILRAVNSVVTFKVDQDIIICM